MWVLFKSLGIIIGWVVPFVFIYLRHVVMVDAGYDVDMFGLILILALIIGFIKWVDKKIEVWTIQDRRGVFIIIWTNTKRILMACGLTWMLYTIEDDIKKIQFTALLITMCFVVGFVFNLLGELIKNKKGAST